MYIAHQKDNKTQTLLEHLQETAYLSQHFAKKIGCENLARLAGLLHDFGKYSMQYQSYINSAAGLIEADADEYIDSDKAKGKIDHSTAGAQLIYHTLKNNKKINNAGELAGQILAICIASHHSGMIDILSPDYTKGNAFKRRMATGEKKAHLLECIKNQDKKLRREVRILLNTDTIHPALTETIQFMRKLFLNPNDMNAVIPNFKLGFLTRFLFSCLIDADRLSSAEFADIKRLQIRLSKPKPEKNKTWSTAIARLDSHLASIPAKNPKLDKIRQVISDECKDKACTPKGIYTLTSPPGTGKTLASLRYALHHAREHKMERILFIIPSIATTEQNADVIKGILNDSDIEHESVLEQHSGLDVENQSRQSKIRSENWDSPIIVTTMTQLLLVLFDGGTLSVRKLHNLAKSVLIFDDIQNLPIKCTHIFCNAINFLAEQAQSTAILCTSTQPPLAKLHAPEKGQLNIKGEIINNANQFFSQLERVKVKNLCKPYGWEIQDIVDFSIKQFKKNRTCLVIVNTKKWAQRLYQASKNKVDKESLFHLSANQCPQHRIHSLQKIKKRLDSGLDVLLFSTSFVECGVDIDFTCVIRFLAGFDSMALAAGRCNRNNLLPMGNFYIINPAEEETGNLANIQLAKKQALRLFNEKINNPLSLSAISRYFDYFFSKYSEDMSYRCKDSQGADTTLLNLLSNNAGHPKTENKERIKKRNFPLLEQSFHEAGTLFNAFDIPTRSIIVPYLDERADTSNSSIDIIARLKKITSLNDRDEAYFSALKESTPFTVNVFPNIFEKLCELKALKEAPAGSNVYILKDIYYHPNFGLITEIDNNQL